MDKERRKHIVNNVLSVPGSSTLNTTPASTPSTIATTSADTLNNNTLNNNTTHTENNASNNNDNQLSSYYTPLPQIDTATAAKLLDFPTDLQRQLLEQLNNSMMVKYAIEMTRQKHARLTICLGAYQWYSTTATATSAAAR